MRLPNTRDQTAVSINMTPMIDVTFLLIIFFLVSSHLAKQENQVKLDLPSTKTGLDQELSRDKSTVTIHVLADGSMQLGSHATTIDAMKLVLQKKQADTPGGLRTRIRTDKHVRYEKISRVLRMCADCGINDIVFAVFEERQR